MDDAVAAEPVDGDPAAKQKESATPTGLSFHHPAPLLVLSTRMRHTLPVQSSIEKCHVCPGQHWSLRVLSGYCLLANPGAVSADDAVQPWPPAAAEEPAPAEAQAEGQEEQQSTTQDAAEPEQDSQAAEEAAGPAPTADESSTEEALSAQDGEPAPAVGDPAPSEPQEVPTEQPASMSPEMTAADAEVEAKEAPIQLLSPAAEGGAKPAPLSSQSEASIR